MASSRGRIRDDTLSGMTSNPTIFEKALAEGDEYDDQIKSAPPGLTAWDLFELVETDGRPHRRATSSPTRISATNGGDGYVSIEVSPGVSNDADGVDRRSAGGCGRRSTGLT